MEILSWNPFQHPLLPTPATPSQQNRWCWIFERSFYTFQTTTDLISTQIQRLIWEKQLINQKSRGFTTITCYTQLHSILHFYFSITFHQHLPHTRTNNPSPTSFSSSFSFFLFPIHTMPSSFVSLHDPWSLSPLSNESFEILLHQSMASSSFKGQWDFENELPSNWN